MLRRCSLWLRTRTTCATNVNVRSFLATVFLSVSTLLAQSVTSRSGSIVYVDAAGSERQITAGHDDRRPSLSLDGRSVVFVRVTNTGPYPSQPKEKQVLESELWLADISGRTRPAVILRGSVITPDRRPLTSFFAPQFAPAGEFVYFLAEFSATSNALCRLDVSRHQASFLTGGVIRFAVLTRGVHRGQIIASMRTASVNPEQGISHPFYILDSHGRQIRRVADESADRRTGGAWRPG